MIMTISRLVIVMFFTDAPLSLFDFSRFIRPDLTDMVSYSTGKQLYPEAISLAEPACNQKNRILAMAANGFDDNQALCLKAVMNVFAQTA
jgi:hypothetical protein